MKLKKVSIEIINSGIIPLLIGAGIVLTTDNVIWGLFGLFSVLVGLALSSQYIENPTQDTSEKRTSEK